MLLTEFNRSVMEASERIIPKQEKGEMLFFLWGKYGMIFFMYFYL